MLTAIAMMPGDKALFESGELPPPAPVVSDLARFSIGHFESPSADPPEDREDVQSDSTDEPFRGARDSEGIASVDLFPEASMKLLRDANQRIVARGGRVVLVHFPTAVIDLRQAEQESQKARWHKTSDETGIPAIHFDDLVGVRDLRCADGQHLNGGDAIRFTAALLDAVDGL